jgi:hypothetical protein
MTTKQKVNWLFRELRKHGTVAYQNVACCMTCASSQLGQEHPGKDVVYYHGQDAEAWNGRQELKRPLAIRYFTEDGGESCRQLGDRITRLAETVGLEWEWNGSPDEVVFITR